jgi:GT2 family glycosyltransferase
MFLIHVTVAYNSPEDLEILFDKIGAQDENLHHIICIDNSTILNKEKNRTICQKYNLYQNFHVEYYPLKENYGSATGFAIGMTLGYNAGANYLWLHDQDGYPLPKCLQEMRKYLMEDLSILSPRILDENNNYIFTFHGSFKKYMSFTPITFTGDFAWSEIAGTAGLFIKREIIDKIGVYDFKHYFTGNEDFDFCLRASKLGFKVCVVRDALYHHPNKWGDHVKNRERDIVRYFGDINSFEKTYKSSQFINFNIKHYKYNFVIIFFYSIIKVLIKKILFKPIFMVPTLKCYILALINRYNNKKVNIDPQYYLE